MTAEANRRGIALMCLAMSAFVVNDALVKLVSQSMPSAQLIFIRGVVATALVGLAAAGLGQRVDWAQLLQAPVLWRSGIEAIGSMIYLVSLFHLPLANATAINLAAPLVLTVFAVVFLGERVGAARWLAVSAGFAGVMLIIQPRASGFNAYAWACLLATLMLVALVLGHGLWGELPNALAWVGIALLVGSGLYVLHSQRPARRA